MIRTLCKCRQLIESAESNVGQTLTCKHCNQRIVLTAAEVPPEGSGAGDFDSRLIVTSGPLHIGEIFLLGGAPDIAIGKLPDKNISLSGNQVSRLHAKLTRLDFGPSRWEIHDNKSTNGLFVNGSRVQSHELKNGDVIDVGEYTLQFVSTFDQPLPEPIAPGSKPCPSCGKMLAPKAKICVACGVDAFTGRSLVVSKGLDENDLAIRVDTWVRIVSFIMPFGLFPIASEAFGTKKPIATWVIAAITIVASIAYFIAWHSTDDGHNVAVQNMMHWTGSEEGTQTRLDDIEKEITAEIRKEQDSGDITNPSGRKYTDKEIQEIAHAIVLKEVASRGEVGFHWYQLLTSAFIHDTSGILEFLYHLGGNMVFFFVFGTRVNELIGNIRMAIIYPLLAIGSGLVDQWVHLHDPLMPGLGASGAIMGLAGMYFLFFPIQKVHMVIWLRLLLRFRTWMAYKVFQMRGVWLLVLWIGLQDVLPVAIGLKGNVDHWAHLGGFMVGFAIALLLLISRQSSAMGNDLLSIILWQTRMGADRKAEQPAQFDLVARQIRSCE